MSPTRTGFSSFIGDEVASHVNEITCKLRRRPSPRTRVKPLGQQRHRGQEPCRWSGKREAASSERPVPACQDTPGHGRLSVTHGHQTRLCGHLDKVTRCVVHCPVTQKSLSERLSQQGESHTLSATKQQRRPLSLLGVRLLSAFSPFKSFWGCLCEPPLSLVVHTSTLC